MNFFLFWMKWCLFYLYLTFVYNCYSTIVWSKRSRYFLGTIQQISLTFSITSLFFKVLSKAKDKYPEFKYIDIFNSQLQSFQITTKIASQISKRHLSAWNIWTCFRRFSRKLTPRVPKKYFNSICVLFILIIW
jgi:hypothetical protein